MEDSRVLKQRALRTLLTAQVISLTFAVAATLVALQIGASQVSSGSGNSDASFTFWFVLTAPTLELADILGMSKQMGDREWAILQILTNATLGLVIGTAIGWVINKLRNAL